MKLEILEGSFSAVSKTIFASKYSVALRDWQRDGGPRVNLHWLSDDEAILDQLAHLCWLSNIPGQDCLSLCVQLSFKEIRVKTTDKKVSISSSFICTSNTGVSNHIFSIKHVIGITLSISMMNPIVFMSLSLNVPT